MRRRLVIRALLSAVPVVLAAAPGAEASCIAAVVVEGRVLFGHGTVPEARLPPVGAETRAVEPACNDAGQDEPDRAISVLTLDGLPPDIAVVRRGSPSSVYVAEGSLTGSAAHPLHRALHRGSSRRGRRPRTCRRVARTVRGTLGEDTAPSLPALPLRTGTRTTVIATDARTRLTNRPPYEPLNPGQRLEVRTSICGTRRFADAIAFDGATVPPPRVESETDTGGVDADVDPRWFAAVGVVAAILALLLAARRLGRDPR